VLFVHVIDGIKCRLRVENETAAMEDQGFSSETEMNMKRATSYRVFVEIETIAMPIAPKITYWSMKKKHDLQTLYRETSRAAPDNSKNDNF